MKSVRLNKFDFRQIARVAQRGLLGSVSYVQHLVMRVAIALSLKLCLFTARVLMSAKTPTSESF